MTAFRASTGRQGASGFTLIELSIALVIIGLIVGGVLVGQNLIRAAEVRAQISQIEKFNTAANTFYGKYGYLPGDIKDPDASNFGFQPRHNGCIGTGDGNGVIEGYLGGCYAAINGVMESTGETVMFWVDLSTAGLIEGGFNTATPASTPSAPITGTSIGSYLPPAKISGNYVFVFSGNNDSGDGGICQGSGVTPYCFGNYFGIEPVTSIAAGGYSWMTAGKGLTVAQAFAMDAKMDDGLPQSGRVLAWNVTTSIEWFNNFGSAVPGSSTTCNDNGNNASNTMQYSVQQNSGNAVNCSLVFRMQAGD